MCCEASLSHVFGHRQPGHACPSHLNIFGQSGATMAPKGRKIGRLYLFIELLTLVATNTFRITKPFVVGTTEHFQDSTHQLNRPSIGVEIPYKLEDQRPLLELMFKAFLEYHAPPRPPLAVSSSPTTLWHRQFVIGHRCQENFADLFHGILTPLVDQQRIDTQLSCEHGDVRTFKTQLDGILFERSVVMCSLFSHITKLNFYA